MRLAEEFRMDADCFQYNGQRGVCVCVKVQKRNGRMRAQGPTGNSCKSWEDFGF